MWSNIYIYMYNLLFNQIYFIIPCVCIIYYIYSLYKIFFSISGRFPLRSERKQALPFLHSIRIKAILHFRFLADLQIVVRPRYVRIPGDFPRQSRWYWPSSLDEVRPHARHELHYRDLRIVVLEEWELKAHVEEILQIVMVHHSWINQIYIGLINFCRYISHLISSILPVSTQ